MALFDKPRNDKILEIGKNDLEKPGVGPFWESGDPVL